MTSESATELRPALTRLSDDEIAFRDAVAALRRGRGEAARAGDGARGHASTPRSSKQYFEMGLMGIEVPEQYGGAGGSLMMVTLAVEEVSKVDARRGDHDRRAEHAGELPDQPIRQRRAEGEVPARASRATRSARTR